VKDHYSSDEQISFAGTEPTKQHAIMVIGPSGTPETFADMKALKDTNLVPGNYEVWRFGGTFAVEEVPARQRVSFQSAIKRPHTEPRKPRKPRKGKSDGASA